LEPTPVRPAANPRIYEVQEGDTLYAIAEKVYGSGKGHWHKRIHQANADKIDDPSDIYVGQKLVIPTAGRTTATERQQAEPVLAGRSSNSETPSRIHREVDLDGVRAFVARPPADRVRRVYVVQSGDNLTRIARKVYQNDSRDVVEKLYQANRDKLQDPDSVYQGMTLRIPS
jgi:nucleoid-associated protein YgaU